MSSDTFYIEIRDIAGDTVEILCTTSTAGGVNDYAITRSFALMALEDGMPYAGDGPKTPLQQAMREVGGATPPVWEEKFHSEHVGKFIASTELVRRIGIVTDERAWQVGRFDGGDDDDAAEKFPSHQFVLRAKVTDPRYLEGLTVGARYGTTAFDSWWNDPTRPTAKQMAAVDAEATYWYPPNKTPASAAPKKAATKKTAKKKAAKKTAGTKAAPKKSSKKTAAKKTTPKKTAKKAAPTKAAPKKSSKKAAPKKAAKKAAPKKAAKKAAPKKTAKKAAPKKKTAKKKSA